VDDYPSCNLLVRKSIMQELGGFNTAFWPGEDTKLCLDITKKLHKRIIYEPTAIIYHHRRPLIFAHLKQITSYALHRGYFVRRYPQTSLRPAYFIPSIFLLSLFSGGIIAPFSVMLKQAYFLAVYFYLLITLISSIVGSLSEPTMTNTLDKARLIISVWLGTILTHLAYGLYFLKGLVSSRLKEEL
jgi:hypothetical protein